MRFYDVNDGAILVDGHNVKDFNRRELRDAFGMVLQDTWLYKGTIMENIRYGKLDATDEEVIAAAKAANAHHFIETLPGGYDCELNEDASNVSQGQKQLLTIARAILADNPILILDEATSGLDPVIRDDILEMFLDFIQDEEHSILVSSHITSDLEKIADYIVFIHEGKVLFSRPKDELTEQYGIIKCNAKQFDELNKNDIIRYKKQDYEWQVLVANRQKAKKEYPHTLVVPASIDDIMLLYVKGEC